MPRKLNVRLRPGSNHRSECTLALGDDFRGSGAPMEDLVHRKVAEIGDGGSRFEQEGHCLMPGIHREFCAC